jgi:hypothetical protein
MKNKKDRFQELSMLANDSNPYTTSLPRLEQLNDDRAYGDELDIYRGYMVIPAVIGIFHTKEEVDEYLELKAEFK